MRGNYRHGHKRKGNSSRIYNIWCAMMQRCYNVNCKAYKDYGGRGILVCDNWKNFKGFLVDMREPLSYMRLERIDNDKGYSLDNCKWATAKEQANNRRSNRFIIYNGKTKTLTDWAIETGIKRETIAFRLKYHWNIKDALFTPAKIGRNQFG